MITNDEVVAYFEAMHGVPPFPWQLQLVRSALDGDWPDAVDAPTGLGKTWSIDVALLVMAAAGQNGDRSVFRRIFFVVDRRTVVDEAWRHTKHVAERLRSAEPGSVLHKVAQGLRALVGSSARGVVVEVVRMRGGATWESLWAERPDQPMVVLSTVDQVGSRLLFRGYGVSNGMRPVHAALVGSHSLMILDEVHLSGPFAELVEDVRGLERRSGLDLPGLRTMSLSATPGKSHGVLAFDVDAHLAHDEAGKRLASDKRLAVMRASGSQRVKSVLALVREIMATDQPRTLIVCNTVASARAVHDALDETRLPVGLLTGRSRPYDRAKVEQEWLTELSGVTVPARGVILVATQTVEVGVNLDVDWLITEECAMSALIQRLGRVNRFGERRGAAVVVSGSGDDLVYGPAAGETTTWLTDHGAPTLQRAKDVGGDRDDWLDVSPIAMRRALGDTGSGNLDPPTAASPMIDDTLFRSWAQTSPLPLVDIPIEQYLHGLSAADTTVAVAWRADAADRGGEESPPLDVPISAAETIELPLASLRAFLSSTGGGLVADVESGLQIEDDSPPVGHVARVSSDGGLETIPAARLRPGDTVVLQTDQGGLDAWGWAPRSTAPVLDVSPLVDRRGRQLILLDPHVIRPLVQEAGPAGRHTATQEATWTEVARLMRQLTDAESETPENGLSELTELLRAAADDGIDEQVKSLVSRLETGKLTGRVLTVDVEHRELGTSNTAPAADAAVDRPGQASAAPDDGLEGSTASLGRRVSLADHGRAVGERAHEFAVALGLPSSVAAAVAWAAEWHDLGKIDPRFQAQLWGGIRPHAALTLLAKSGMSSRSAQWHAARRLAGYPRGMRHEALSAKLVRVRLAIDDAGLDTDVDRELVAHLVAAHHGRARPLLNTVDDPDPQALCWREGGHSVEVTSDVDGDLELVEEFDRLNKEYGPWGLALLEAVVRLADIACSREGS